MNELSTDHLSDKVIGQIWVRMTSIYGHKWASQLGRLVDDNGKMSDAARCWQKGLINVTVDDLKVGFDALARSGQAWPPSLPEFRKMCLCWRADEAPTLEHVVSIIATASNRAGALIDRYRHPIALEISKRVDMHALRMASNAEAKRLIGPIYEKLLITGYPGWPDHATEDQNAIGHEKKAPNVQLAMDALSAMRRMLRPAPDPTSAAAHEADQAADLTVVCSVETTGETANEPVLESSRPAGAAKEALAEQSHGAQLNQSSVDDAVLNEARDLSLERHVEALCLEVFMAPLNLAASVARLFAQQIAPIGASMQPGAHFVQSNTHLMQQNTLSIGYPLRI